MFTPFNSLPLLYPTNYLKKMWRGIVFDPLDKEAINQPKGQGWVTLKAIDGTLLIRINDIAKLLNTNEKDILCRLTNSGSWEKLSSSLHQRFLVQPWEKILSQILKKYPRENYDDYALEIIKKIEQTRNVTLFNSKYDQIDAASHFTRKNSQTELPIEISKDGRQWCILKSESNSPPYDEGVFKKIYHAINLHSLQLAVWGKAYLTAKCSRSEQEIRDDINSEISIQSSLDSPEFVKIFHHVFYKNKKGIEKVGIMMECCDGNLTGLLKRRQENNDEDLSQAFWNILEDILSALTVLEKRKIHHRDVKLDNIFYVETEEGIRGKLADFGFAIDTEKEMIKPKSLGSPLYTAPEFIKGHEMITEGQKLLDSGCNYQLLREHYKASTQSCLDLLSKIKSGDLFRYEEEREIKRTYQAHSGLISHYDKASTDHTSNGKELIKKGTELVANTRGDLWALGMVLFEMRTGKNPLVLFTNKPEYRISPSYFYSKLTGMQQEKMNSYFPPVVSPLAAFNLALFTIDPAKRPSAEFMYQTLKNLRKNNTFFT